MFFQIVFMGAYNMSYNAYEMATDVQFQGFMAFSPEADKLDWSLGILSPSPN